VFSVNAIKIRPNQTAVTIYSKKTDSYVCFDKHWRIKTFRAKPDMSGKRCQFLEKIGVSGAFLYHSVENESRYLGFHKKNGKPIRAGPKKGAGGAGGREKPIDKNCYNFHPIKVASFYEQKQQGQPARQEPKVTRPQQQQQQHQPRLRHNRHQEVRKHVAASEANVPTGGNSLLSSGYLATVQQDQRQPPTHRRRHKNGVYGRHGKFHPSPAASTIGLADGNPNLESGYTGATSPPVAATLSSLYGGSNANGDPGGRPIGSVYGKATHRRSHLNSYVPPLAGAPSPLLPSSLSAIVTKLPPKSSAHAAHHALDVGSSAGLYRKDRRQTIGASGPSMESTSGRVSSGKRKSISSSNGTNGSASGRNSSTKVNAMPGRDKRASG
uniref:Fibroblast growth factor n=1 Tax=Anopheles culicifacies TaxID=139723 RepID=A0A182MQK2_9DIPT